MTMSLTASLEKAVHVPAGEPRWQRIWKTRTCTRTVLYTSQICSSLDSHRNVTPVKLLRVYLQCVMLPSLPLRHQCIIGGAPFSSK